MVITQKKHMKKLLYLPLLLVFMSCSESEEPESNLFREIYKNTFWEIDSQLFTFATDKLVSIGTEASCDSWEVGNFNNVDYDGCIYNSVSYVVVSEDKSSFTFKQTVSSGKTPGIGVCKGEDTTISFEVINENEMKVKINVGSNPNSDSFIIKRSNKKFTPSNCEKGPSNTGLF
jgi:hypothetical protein